MTVNRFILVGRIMLWAGLDVGFSATSLCIVDDNGKVVAEKDFDTSPGTILEMLGEYAIDLKLVGLEASAATLKITRHLRDNGFTVAMFEARSASRFLRIRRNKTDTNDARGLADLGRLGGTVVPQVYLKSDACQKLRSQLTFRHQIVRQRVILEAMIRANLQLHGGRWSPPASGTSLQRKVLDELASLKRSGTDAALEVEPILALAVSMRRYVETLDRRLAKDAGNHPVCRRLMTVPGVGPIAALSFYSAIEDPRRFSNSAAVGAYFGLAPVVKQSGDKMRREGISKMGNPLTRTHLCQAASFMLSKRTAENRIRSWGLSLAERSGQRRARVAVARKLATVMLTIWKNDADFSYA